MSHAVLALGAALVTAAGCVWYVPALADLRAGADRPVSRRSAAKACLSGWATVAVVAAALLMTGTWWVPGVSAATGAVVTTALRIRAVVHNRRELREAGRDWAELRQGPPPADAHRSRTVVVTLVCAALAAAAAAAFLLAAAGAADRHWLTIAVVPTAVIGVALTLAVTHASMARRTAAGHPWPRR
ncbi:hypothetical protein [Streptomyces sp. MK7]|uniref:hypothetical protein n=1 Tax=Streptomyces sp. MK7 TaxID=3067635 RepID=UPI0029303927|nr:hypothetical protein [Streptomyces sp. MK7]